MARVQDVRQFDADSYRATVLEMRTRGEDVHAAGRRHRDQTGGLHPNVEIRGKKPRGSHNALVPGNEPGSFVLLHGISLPVLSLFDGTGSTASWLEVFFRTAERQNKLLEGVRTRYNPQLASGVANDVYYTHHDDLAVVQVTQFESDERAPEQVRLLFPGNRTASVSNDTTAEDYDLALFYATLIYGDLWTFYGLKGYLTIALDEVGKGSVSAEGIREYLGQSIDTPTLDTRKICQQLFDHWHLFIIQVPGGWGVMQERTTRWWSECVGQSRVIQVEDPNLLADVRAALIYATEANNPTKQGLTEFFQAGSEPIDAYQLDKVWRTIQVAREHFGAQAKLPGYQDIPRLGDVFAHYRHAWPIGHPRESENVTPAETS